MLNNRIIRGILKGLGWAACALAALAALWLLVMMVSEYRPQAVEEVKVSVSGRERSVREGDRIEIVTFNVGYGGLDETMDSFLDGGKMNTPGSHVQVESNLEGIIGIIREQSYDVLFLQEVDRDSRRSYYIEESKMFETKLGGKTMFAQDVRCLFVPYPFLDVVGRINSGLQTQTGLKIRSAERIALPTSYTWPARVCQPKRCMLVTRIPVEDSGRELVLINVHMDAYDNGEGKAAQSHALAEFMKKEYELGNYVIAGGDFNQVFPDDDFSSYPIRTSKYFVPGRLERSQWGADWTFASDRMVPTCRLLDLSYAPRYWWTQFYVIDGFILSPNVTLEAVKTIDAEFEYSDHNPVKLTAILGK